MVYFQSKHLLEFHAHQTKSVYLRTTIKNKNQFKRRVPRKKLGLPSYGLHRAGNKNLHRMMENEFKFRFNNHKMTFKHKKHATKTALSKYICDLKEKHCAYSINWSILKHANSCNSGSNNYIFFH